MAVIMSSGSAYLNSTAVVFVKDIFLPFIRPNASDSQVLWVERLVTAIVGVGAIVFAILAPSIIDAILLSYNLWAPTIIIPLVLAVLWGLRGGVVALYALLLYAVSVLLIVTALFIGYLCLRFYVDEVIRK